MDVQLREPKTEEDFRLYYDLRWRILREPWTRARESAQDEHEDDAFHIMAFEEGASSCPIQRSARCHAAPVCPPGSPRCPDGHRGLEPHRCRHPPQHLCGLPMSYRPQPLHSVGASGSPHFTPSTSRPEQGRDRSYEPHEDSPTRLACCRSLTRHGLIHL